MHIQIPTTGEFPEKEVEACIRDALAAELDAQQILRPRAASACEPEVDSLVVVEVICAIEELLGVELPTSFAPRGGFSSIDGCVSSLVAETQAIWDGITEKAEEAHVN